MNMESNLEMSRVVYKRGEIQQLNSRVRAKGLISVLVGFVIRAEQKSSRRVGSKSVYRFITV